MAQKAKSRRKSDTIEMTKSMAMKLYPEDQKLVAELQRLLETTQFAATVREAFIRTGQSLGLKITRTTQGAGYRVEG